VFLSRAIIRDHRDRSCQRFSSNWQAPARMKWKPPTRWCNF
jgi:hypothetical protein